jgi:hypothetical protein
MKPPERWPLHRAPIDGEALSSWLHRIAASYEMTAAQLIEHGLGHDPNVEADLDLDPPPALLDALAARTGITQDRLRQMCLAGWVPWLLDSLQPHPAAFDTYVRQFSVLLKPGTRSKRAARPWVAWVSPDPGQRACPRCVEDPGRQGLLLMAQVPLTLSCLEHGLLLEPCFGFPGEYLTWAGGDPGPRTASDAVLAMDRRTHQALSTGHVELPGRDVHAGVWFRLLRTLLDEVSTPATYWARRGTDLRVVWGSCGHRVRAGQATWRPFESYPWPVQTQLLAAAAHAIALLEDGTVTGRGTHAELFYPVHPPVDDGCPPSQTPKDAYTVAGDRVRASLDKVVQAAREDPAEAQALYDLLMYGARTPQSIEAVLANLADLGIPTAHLSPKPVLVPLA